MSVLTKKDIQTIDLLFEKLAIANGYRQGALSTSLATIISESAAGDVTQASVLKTLSSFISAPKFNNQKLTLIADGTAPSDAATCGQLSVINSLAIHIEGDETILGNKTFAFAPILSCIKSSKANVNGHIVPECDDDVFILSKANQEIINKVISGKLNEIKEVSQESITGLTENLDSKAENQSVVHLYGTEIIDGNKTFSGILAQEASDTKAGGGILNSSPVTRYTAIDVDEVLILSDGTIPGQRKRTLMLGGTGNGILIPEHFSDGNKILLKNKWDMVELEWSGSTWKVIALIGAILV